MKSTKNHQTSYFSYFSPPQKGTLTLTPGMGWGGGPPKSKKIPNSLKQLKKQFKQKIICCFPWKGTLTLTLTYLYQRIQFPVCGFQIPDSAYQTLDSEYWILVFGFMGWRKSLHNRGSARALFFAYRLVIACARRRIIMN